MGKDLFIYEETYRCFDCENEVGSHNSYHLPHTTFRFSFNEPDPDFDEGTFSSSSLVETWEVSELRDLYENPDFEFGCKDLSWTQLAIARCQELGS